MAGTPRRRGDRARMVAKARRLYPDALCPRKLADNLTICSCPCCGNPRRQYKGSPEYKLTVPERRLFTIEQELDLEAMPAVPWRLRGNGRWYFIDKMLRYQYDQERLDIESEWVADHTHVRTYGDAAILSVHTEDRFDLRVLGWCIADRERSDARQAATVAA